MPPESDAPGNEPHLELPSLGFRRKKRRDKHADDDEEIGAQAGQDVGGAAVSEQDIHRAPAAPSAADRAPAASPSPARPAARPAARPPSRPVTPSSASTAARPKPTPARPPARPAAHPPAAPPAPAAGPETASVARETAPSARDTEPTTETPAPDFGADTAVLGQMAAGLDEPRRAKRSSRGQERAARADEQARKRQDKQEAKRAAKQEKAELKAQRQQEKLAQQEAARAAKEELEEEPVGGVDVEQPQAEPTVEEDDDGARFAPAELLVARLPEIKPAYAAIISGLLAGLAAVLLAFGAASGCDAVRGTSSCGGGAGLLAIVAILAVEVLIGANLLKAWQISDPFSTSFLGVGVVATIAMLVFLDDLNSPWMLLVIPLMTAVAFALSWWVTVRFIDEHPMTSEVDSEHGEPDFKERAADEDSNA